MHLFLKKNISKENFFNILMVLFPFSFIAGNMIININILFLIIPTFLIFYKEIINLKYYFLDKIIFVFFLFILITGIINDYYFYLNGFEWRGFFPTIVKSILFFKYLMIYISIRILIEKQIVNFKPFFISCSLASIFVCFDIFFQFWNGVDIFGYEKVGTGRKLAGPFGDEQIAGGFIQRFSIFSFFLFSLFYDEKFKKSAKFLIPLLFLIFTLGIILSGNRMPLLLFVFLVFLVLLFQKNLRKILFVFLIILPLFFTLVLNLNSEVRTNFNNFYKQVSQMVLIIYDKNSIDEKTPLYFKQFESFHGTWLMNKYIGGGIKNFRYYCHVNPKSKNTDFKCNMHPHNYFLEILTETGLIGFSLILIIFSTVIYLTLIKKYFLKSSLNNNKIIVPFIFLFLVEIFPLKSTGSFFTTNNASFLFLIMSILIALARKQYLIENKN